jgi:sec-independent protein translocase protein TatA
MPLLLLGLGTVELVVLLLIFLVLFGSRLPKAAGNIGASIKEFKKGMKEASADDADKPAKTDAEKT